MQNANYNKISNNLLKNFSKKGYVILNDILETYEVDFLRKICDELLLEPCKDNFVSEGKNINKGNNRRFLSHRHQDFTQLSNFLLSDIMKLLLVNFIGKSSYLFNEQFVVKGANSSSSFGWHQDSAYIPFDHKPYLTIWIALDDITSLNGPLCIISRNIERMTLVKHKWDNNAKELVGYHGKNIGIPIEVSSGSMIIFSSLTMHRSDANKSLNPRRAYVAQYSSEPIIDPDSGEMRRFATPL